MSNFDAMSILTQNIRRLMREQGLRQEDLADRTGILRPNISRLLTSPDANPQLSKIQAIATALGVTVSDLFAEISEKVSC